MLREISTWIMSCLDISIVIWYEGILIKQDIFPTQVMTHHKAYVREKALNNKLVTHNTFVFASNEKNLINKRIDELWQKHPKDPINVWVLENPKSIFYYFQHAPIGPKFIKLGWHIIHTQNSNFVAIWNDGKRHQSLISFNATFGTN